MFSNNPTLAKLGMALIAIGLVLVVYTYLSNQGFVKTEGEVVSVKTITMGSIGNRSTTHTPTISFFDEGNAKHLAPSNFSASDYNYKQGTKVNIVYDPNDLSSVRIASIGSLWRLPLIFFGLGAFLLWLATLKTVEPKEAEKTDDSEHSVKNDKKD